MVQIILGKAQTTLGFETSQVILLMEEIRPTTWDVQNAVKPYQLVLDLFPRRYHQKLVEETITVKSRWAESPS